MVRTLEKRAEAAAWLARLRGPGRTGEIDRGFRRWLKADAAHKQAFELLSERLEMVEGLKSRPIPLRWRNRDEGRAMRWKPLSALAATVALVMTAALVYPRFAGIETAVGEQRTLTLADGTRIYLNTDTRIVLHYDDSSRRIDLKRGEALFEVAGEARRPFSVRAGDRRVNALGTSFVVRHERNRTAVTLMEGSVTVSRVQGTDEVGLEPGQRLTLLADKQPRMDTPPLDRVIAWRQGQVALDDMPLAEAIMEMNRYSSVRLSVERPEARSVRVAGFFRMGDSASFARAVAASYGLRVIRLPDEIILAGAPTEK
jgi:transmembrane sensor